jgi:peptidoglycan/LPS O-acetylase OafA/YrhL
MPSRFWELGFGCIVFLMNDKFKKFNIVEKFPSFLTFILLLGCLFLPNDFHKTINTLVVIVLSSLLLWQIKYNDITYKILTQKQISYIGLISYSLYLWHWPILSLSRWTVGIYWHTAIWQIPLMILLSIISYEYVESRLRKANWSARNRNIVLIGGFHPY